MARTSRTAARVQRLTSLVATVLVAIATAWAFGRVFEGKPATIRLLAAGVASAVVAWALERRSLLLAVTVSAALMVAALGFFVFHATTWHGLPTLATLGQAASAAADVGEQARIQVAPTPAGPALMLAGITAVWAAVFSCHALAFRAGSPLLALVPPVALVAFADTVLEEFTKPLYGAIFLAAALAIAFADGVRRVQGWGPVWNGPGTRDRLSSTAGRGARRVAGGALVVAIAAPLFVPGFGSQAVIDLSTVNGGGRVNVNPLVSLGSRLNDDQPVEVFKVQSSEPSYWRMIGLEDFDGTTWRPDLDNPGDELDAGAPLIDTAASAGSHQLNQDFQITTDLGYPWVAAAYPPSSITVQLHWNAGTQTATLDSPLEADDTYSVTSMLPNPTPDALRAIAFPVSGQDPALTELPPDMPPEIAALARQWTTGSTSSYDSVIAIQSHLRDPSVFTYSTDVPYRDDITSLVDFLTSTQRGFCQQFASAMAVLLRSIGLPARVAVGYTQGTLIDDIDTRSVTTKDLHSWVEVLFPGYGWLSFEPTPGFADSAAAGYQFDQNNCGLSGICGDGGGGPPDVKAGDGKGDGGTSTIAHNKFRHARAEIGGERGNRSPASDPFPAGPEAGKTSAARPGLVLASMGLLVVLGLLVIPPARAIARRRRLRRARGDPRTLVLATYDVFTQRAGDLGLSRGPGETPEEYRGRVSASGLATSERLGRLTRLTVGAAYSAASPTRDDADDARADAEETLRELRKATPLVRRLTGPYRRER